MNANEQLQHFSYLADRLRQEPLVRTGWDNSFSLNYDRAVGGTTFTLRQPDEVAFRSLLLLLRRFVSAGEPAFLNRIYNVCEQSITSDELRHFVRTARHRWKEAQRAPGLKLVYNDKELTPEHLADLWINGYYFHDDVSKLRELESIAVFGLDRFNFVGFVGDTVRHVLYVDNIIRHALRDGSVR